MDLFNNPIIENAKKALTEEQKEEYKKIGEYMYKDIDYKNVETKTKVATDEETIYYASEALKAGGDPNDLSVDELKLLNKTYGEKWYERFNLTKHEVPKESLSMNELIIKDAEDKLKNLKMSRQQKRAMERLIEKEKNKQKKK